MQWTGSSSRVEHGIVRTEIEDDSRDSVVDVLIGYAIAHGSTRGIAERIGVRLLSGVVHAVICCEAETVGLQG